MTGIKHDAGKARYDLIPWDVMDDVAHVITHGAEKYGPDNWMHVEPHRYLAAAFRHLVARAQGEVLDTETGRPHTAHAIACLLFLGWHDKA